MVANDQQSTNNKNKHIRWVYLGSELTVTCFHDRIREGFGGLVGGIVGLALGHGWISCLVIKVMRRRILRMARAIQIEMPFG